jgi:hypothetical protein
MAVEAVAVAAAREEEEVVVVVVVPPAALLLLLLLLATPPSLSSSMWCRHSRALRATCVPGVLASQDFTMANKKGAALAPAAARAQGALRRVTGSRTSRAGATSLSVLAVEIARRAR